MVVYGEGSYRCAEHGVVMTGDAPTAQLRERRWEPRCPVCGANTEPFPMTEDKPLRPVSVYGIGKREIEELALVLGEAYGFEAVALRYLNVYGPRQALAQPLHRRRRDLLLAAARRHAPRVFEDGEQIRDLVHVSDVVAATRAAMDAAAHQARPSTSRPAAVCGSASSRAQLSDSPRSRAASQRSPASSAPVTSATASPTRTGTGRS